MNYKIFQNHLEMLMFLNNGEDDFYAKWESYRQYLKIKGVVK